MTAIADDTTAFKCCTVCGCTWDSLRDFVTDSTLRVDGYQACFANPQAGLVMVTHCEDHCGTTLGLMVGALRPLYDGPEHQESYYGREPCRELCLRHNILEECDVDCEMAWARTALQWLRRHALPPHLSER